MCLKGSEQEGRGAGLPRRGENSSLCSPKGHGQKGDTV